MMSFETMQGLRISYIEDMSKITDRAAFNIWAAVTVCMCKLICVFVVRIYDHKAGFVVLARKSKALLARILSRGTMGIH